METYLPHRDIMLRGTHGKEVSAGYTILKTSTQKIMKVHTCNYAQLGCCCMPNNRKQTFTLTSCLSDHIIQWRLFIARANKAQIHLKLTWVWIPISSHVYVNNCKASYQSQPRYYAVFVLYARTRFHCSNSRNSRLLCYWICRFRPALAPVHPFHPCLSPFSGLTRPRCPQSSVAEVCWAFPEGEGPEDLQQRTGSRTVGLEAKALFRTGINDTYIQKEVCWI